MLDLLKAKLKRLGFYFCNFKNIKYSFKNMVQLSPVRPCGLPCPLMGWQEQLPPTPGQTPMANSRGLSRRAILGTLVQMSSN